MENVLILVLKEELSLVSSYGCPDPCFRFAGEEYADSGWGDFTGFYDWLRNFDNQIVGVRHNPWAEFDVPYGSLARLPYVEMNNNIIDYYFSTDRTVDEANSGDQRFLDNRIYSSPRSIYAVSFNYCEEVKSFPPELLTRILSLDDFC